MGIARVVIVTAAGLALLAAASAAVALPEYPAEYFEPPENCGCHTGLIEDWQPSMHAKALTDPLYVLKRDDANRASDGKLGEFCDSCHAPVAIMAGLDTSDPAALPAQATHVGCTFCHQVTGTEKPLGNVSQVLQAGSRIFRAQYDDSTSPYHETAYSGFHETAEFCGACHNVDHPADRNLHLEATYTEWKNSPYAEEGIVCQDCHMTPGPGVTKPYPGSAAAGGPQRDHVYEMTFAGGNVGLGDSVRAEERLKAAATVEIEAPEIASAGESTSLTVTVTNVGAGHYLPTGLTEVRQMWLEVVALDSRGGEISRFEHHFGTELRDAEGNAPVELWEAVAIHSDDRIPPKGSSVDEVSFDMPDGDLTEVIATLFYRSCPEEMAERAGVDIPTTTMASARTVIFTSEEARERGIPGDDEGGTGSGPMVLGLALSLGLLGLAGFAVQRFRRSAKDENSGPLT